MDFNINLNSQDPLEIDSQIAIEEEPVDIKPLFLPNLYQSSDEEESNSAKKWSPGKWQDANRKSAFRPYKQQVCTVLTNLQRGNTQAETPIPQETEVGFHTRAGQGEITAEDIKNEPSIDVRDSNGLTALHWASAYGQLMSVTLLYQSGAKMDCDGPEGETPLLLAASGGHHDVVRYLLNEGALVNQLDHVRNTALMYAAYGNHPHCCNELLLRGADLTISNMYDETAYSLACDNNSNLAQAVIENCLLNIISPIS